MLHHRCALIFILAAAFASSAPAASNLSFETGNLNGWDVHGYATVVDANFGISPTHGTYQAKVESSPNGQAAATLASNVGIDLATFEQWAAFPSGYFGPDPQPPMYPVEGSAISQEIALGAGDWVSFDYHFLTNELPNTQTHNDFSFAALVGPGGNLVDGFVLANTYDVEIDWTLTTAYTSWLPDGNYQSAELFAGSTAGLHRLVFGVLDAADDGEDVSWSSVVLVDNVNTHVIPLPAAAWSGLALLGLMSVPAILRRRRLAA